MPLETNTLPPTSWRADALCRGLPVAAWFDPQHEPAARALCERCPVADSCLAYAVEHGCEGTWGVKVLPGRGHRR